MHADNSARPAFHADVEIFLSFHSRRKFPSCFGGAGPGGPRPRPRPGTEPADRTRRARRPGTGPAIARGAPGGLARNPHRSGGEPTSFPRWRSGKKSTRTKQAWSCPLSDAGSVPGRLSRPVQQQVPRQVACHAACARRFRARARARARAARPGPAVSQRNRILTEPLRPAPQVLNAPRSIPAGHNCNPAALR